MGWATGDKAAIAKFLGIPRTDGTLAMVQSAMNQTSGLGDEFVLECQEYVRELRKIDQEISEGRGFATVAFQSSTTGTKQFQRGDRLVPVRGEGRRYAELLAEALGLAVRRDIFSTAKPGNARSVRG